MSDFRYAVRLLKRSPGFTLLVVGLLAVGIGANAAIFSAFDALLLRPLPVRHPEELVRMVQAVPRVGTISSFEHEFYAALKERATTLSAVFGDAEWPVAMDDPKPAVLSYGFWQRRFEGDPRAVGRTLTLRGHKFLIAGVMPHAFNGITADTAPDLRIPVRAFPLLQFEGAFRGDGIALEVAARKRPGATLSQVQAECFAIWHATTEAYLKNLPNMTPDRMESEMTRGLQVESLERGASVLRDRFGPALRVMLASVGLLLLLLCSNVAGLLLARSAARREEIAVRLAIGATRLRLVRQMLAESLLLAGLGAAGGWLVAAVSLPLLVRALPPMRDRATTQLGIALNLTPDARVLLYSLAVDAGTALLFGLAPALAAARTSLDSVLRSARSSGGWRGRQALVVFQVALCTLLLWGAGLLVRSFRQLHGMNPGFDSEHVVTFTLNPGLSGYNKEQCETLRRSLLDRVRAMPGVVSAASASRALMRGSGVKTTVMREGRKATPADFLNTSLNTVSPEYFDTIGMHVLAGRNFQGSDSGARPARVVINQTFARQFFPGEDPLGQHVGNASNVNYEIIAVVNDAKYRSLREPMTPTLYQVGADDVFVIHVRTRMRPESIIQPVRRALAAMDPALPIIETHTLAEEVDASAAPERLTASLASLFGILAAALASVGIYGLLAYAVTLRRREIGIRVALGAQPGDVARMIARQSLVLVAIGVIAGLGAAWEAGPAIRSLLYGVTASDGAALGTAAGFVLAVSALATVIPAVRASRIEPASALREEG